MTEWSPFRTFVPRNQRTFLAWPDLLVVLLTGTAIISLWIGSRSLPGYEWRWSLLADFLLIRTPDDSWKAGLLMQGLFTTLRVGFWTFIFSLAMGFILALASISQSALLSWTSLAATNLLRNTPPLVILFVVYFFAGNFMPVAAIEKFVTSMPSALAPIFEAVTAPKGEMDRMLAAVLALGCYQGAYVAEILRGGIQSVPRGQWDAAKALGFGRLAAVWLIILPQAARSIVPPLTGQCISTFKDSALASLISLPDLTFQSLEIMAVSSMTFEIWTITALIYLVVGLSLAGMGRLLEIHFSLHLKR